jgi:hypothetical protein
MTPSEKDFLTQMAAMNRSCMAMCKQFIVANPDSDLEDFAEECFEDCAGDAALCDLWLSLPSGDEGAAAGSKTIRPGVVYLKGKAP